MNTIRVDICGGAREGKSALVARLGTVVAAEGKRFIVAESANDEHYTSNLRDGAPIADVIVIVVDARQGITAATRRHGFFASLLAVRQVILAVNKMDLVDDAQAAYARISELEPNPELEKTIDRILSIKARHLTFFEPQSEYRLGASVGAQKLARKRLKKSAWPIGADELPMSDRQYFFDRLFRSSTGLAESIDTAIDGLPGLTGLGLIARAAGTRSAA